MKYISILEEMTPEAIEVYAEKRGMSKDLIYRHPQEDFLSMSEKIPAFVVADGVTLDIAEIERRGEKYPNPSPAGEVAQIFCNAVIENAEEMYENFTRDYVPELFKEANKEVEKYNEEKGKSDISGNITDHFAATAAFVIIKEDKAYWASICDSFVAHFDKDMNEKYISSGSCTPYAVVSGQENMVEYLEYGVFDIEEGDRIFVFTDGFKHYAKNTRFQELFKDWGENIKERIKGFSEEMNAKDPQKYGHERSVIAISV